MYIYVLNLPAGYPSLTLAHHLRGLFARYGTVSDVEVRKEPNHAGPPSSYAFVEMPSPHEAGTAIEALHDSEFSGSRLSVTPAMEGGTPAPFPPWQPLSRP